MWQIQNIGLVLKSYSNSAYNTNTLENTSML